MYFENIQVDGNLSNISFYKNRDEHTDLTLYLENNRYIQQK